MTKAQYVFQKYAQESTGASLEQAANAPGATQQTKQLNNKYMQWQLNNMVERGEKLDGAKESYDTFKSNNPEIQNFEKKDKDGNILASKGKKSFSNNFT